VKGCGIELLFKKMEQNFQLHYFCGKNETVIRTQPSLVYAYSPIVVDSFAKEGHGGEAFSVMEP
jgi:hypothetical protein